ncbi:MAG TPA: trypsin-like peptidase domain-containing protein [Gemmatimonadales bacterium]|jgi:serine protease Do|nr:trypsin-like peptidase domain-containing protein [Gemmatimonadales bacterium]
MSVRSLNWLKFGGLVGLAFVLGLLFAGLLDLPKNSLAQGGGVRLTGTQSVKTVDATPLPAARPLAELSDAFSAVAEHIRPSVVFIKSERKERVAQMPQVPRGFEPFFNFPQQRGQPRIERGSGSGFVVSADGYILTNNHVVDGAQKVTVQLLDRRSFPAKVIGTDPNTDVAVIKIEARGLEAAALGSSSSTKIGEWVLAVGNPLGENLTFTVTSGIVSAKGRGQLNLPGRSDRSIQDFIQTDAAINPGNSGGPLVNVRGEVIGINSAIASETGYNVGYGFAIPIDLAKQVMEQLIKNGKVERAALGVYVGEVSPTDAEYVGLPEVRGVKISRFSIENSPAKQAGLVEGDVILAIDGRNVDYVSQLQQIVGFRHPGETVKVEVARKGGERRTVSVRLISAAVTGQQTASAEAGEQEESADKSGESPAGTTVRSLGVSVSPLTTAMAGELGLPATVRGLLVQNVDPEGPAAEILFGANNSQSPDIIVSVEGVQVRSAGDLSGALRRAGPGGIVSVFVYNSVLGGQRVERVRLGER